MTEMIRANFNEIQEIFIKKFNQNWGNFTKKLFFQQQQFSTGNRLRPLIVLLGYLSTKECLDLSESEYDKISKISISIELIHKSSLILDDLIDKDPARHGKTAFHVEYGVDNTIMFAVNMLSVSVENFKKIIDDSSDSEFQILKREGMDLLIKTMYDMSLGELKELNLKEFERYHKEYIEEIIHLETSPLIANSLLLGYYAGNGYNKNIIDIFKTIGYKCGYIFQIMNDLEPFCQQKKLLQHKGRINTDITQSKKNIVIPLLYDLLSQKEKKQLSQAESADTFNSLLITYFNNYNVINSFLREVNFIHEDIHNQTVELSCLGLNKDWCVLLSYFVDHIVQECKERLS